MAVWILDTGSDERWRACEAVTAHPDDEVELFQQLCGLLGPAHRVPHAPAAVVLHDGEVVLHLR